MFNSEHGAGTTEPGGHLIGDQQHTIAITQLSYPLQIPCRMHQHPAGPLQQRLNHHSGQLLLMHGHQPFQFTQAGHATGQGISFI